MESRTPTFSGYQRQRKTRFSVRFSEICSRLLITLGGIGTIVAIILVCVFLVWVAVPLMFGSKSHSRPTVTTTWKEKPLAVGMDEDQLLGWILLPDGTLVGYRLDNGTQVSSEKLFPELQITAVSPPNRNNQLLLGFEDGTMSLGTIQVEATIVPEEQNKPDLNSISVGIAVIQKNSLMTRRANGQLISLSVKASFDTPMVVSPDKPLRLLDISHRPSGPIIASLAADGILRVSDVYETKNLITGKVTRKLTSGEFNLGKSNQFPDYLFVNGVGDNVYLLWKTGTLRRINIQDIMNPAIVQDLQVVPDRVQVTAAQFLIGKATLLIGDSRGTVSAWFRIRPPGYTQGDASILQNAHKYQASSASVTALATSSRSRILGTAHADGTLAVFNATNQSLLTKLSLEPDSTDQQLQFAPKEDGLYAWSSHGLASWWLEPGHHEATFRSLIRPVWYEGYVKPAHVWQSTSGDDAFEPKYGLWPLIFGTLKATIYSLLIAVPLALCAAIYSREFLHPRVRAIVKPSIEVMASLPSVVLGFLGALVIAPWVESGITTLLTAVVFIPLGLALGGHLWHVLPQKLQRSLIHYRFLFVLGILPLALYLSVLLASPIEHQLFGTDLKTWLYSYSAEPGVRELGERGASGWFLVLLPVASIVSLVLSAQYINPVVRQISRQVSASREAYLNLLKFFAIVLVIFGLAWCLGLLLQAFGLDPRTSFFGKYDQKNAFVAGLMMGFAIIPIIYTLAEDALSSVPDHLRSASLGCGATIWQTAARIVLPTAMGGIFSAVMVGLGRAVGETMIVLMVGGNVPVLDINLFNGFRTLSANIAVELPEAVQNSTHYRILFLSALTLFAFTFVLNTIAESLRQRFRKRAFEL